MNNPRAEEHAVALRVTWIRTGSRKQYFLGGLTVLPQLTPGIESPRRTNLKLDLGGSKNRSICKSCCHRAKFSLRQIVGLNLYFFSI